MEHEIIYGVYHTPSSCLAMHVFDAENETPRREARASPYTGRETATVQTATAQANPWCRLGFIFSPGNWGQCQSTGWLLWVVVRIAVVHCGAPKGRRSVLNRRWCNLSVRVPVTPASHTEHLFINIIFSNCYNHKERFLNGDLAL